MRTRDCLQISCGRIKILWNHDICNSSVSIPNPPVSVTSRVPIISLNLVIDQYNLSVDHHVNYLDHTYEKNDQKLN